MGDRHGQTVPATRFAQLTGVSRERLRTWERRFGFPAPVRVAEGRRRYALADVARVVAVRRAAEDGTPLAVAVAAAAAVDDAPLPEAAFRAALERAPTPVALVSGPAPLRVEWANAALRAAAGPGGPDAGGGPAAHPASAERLAEHLTRDLPALELVHPSWGEAAGGPARSLAYRLPVGPGQRAVVAVVGLDGAGDADARAALAAAEAERDALREVVDRQDRWLAALGALALQFQHEPGPGVVDAALDVLVRQIGAIDVGLAAYVSGRLVLDGSRRGLLADRAVTVAAHPEVGRALRDAEPVWLPPPTLRAFGVPEGLHAVGLPVAVAGEVLGLLVVAVDEVRPPEEGRRRMLAAVSAAVGFAVLRDRLVRELRAAVSGAPATARRRSGPPGAGGRPPGG